MWLGVTVAIPEPYRSTLSEARARSGDPLASTIPPHVTLLPPTEVAQEDVPAVQEHIAAVASAHDAFKMALAGTSTFRPVTPVVFVNLTRGAQQCDALQRDLNDGLLTQQREFPYHPHVTIAHNLSAEALDQVQVAMAGFSGEFNVPSIELFEHSGDVWQQRMSFPLGDIR